jgi:dTDP-3-amino-2,3,6-trideoxy-4-keto-D-glucose/dTDP-3-amino-3,4,6-trideoxy-alpha-D-glucose/dTDP-2,6-dideoxy-D-kanosamine transaminase
MQVNFSYLDRQFADVDAYLADVKQLVLSGDFTLGKPVREFEQRFAKLTGLKHAVGVNSGTDALLLPIRLLGIGPGDEVITAANTFIASVGAIAMNGATPVFVDNDESYTINPKLIEEKITKRTKAILPVHYTGNAANMPAVMEIAKKHNLHVVEDACQAIGARYDDKLVGSWGAAAGFSLHPLKNLNVWGDAGMCVTNSDEMNEKLRLIRNHGMLNRDEYAMYGFNSRLDSLQAVIGNRLIDQTSFITSRRIANAQRLDEGLSQVAEYVSVPKRPANVKHVYHLYIVRVKDRDKLLAHLKSNGIDAKIHYPIPMHLQKAAAHLGYKRGDFPQAEFDGANSITLPAHQHLTNAEIDYVIDQIKVFYKKGVMKDEATYLRDHRQQLLHGVSHSGCGAERGAA